LEAVHRDRAIDGGRAFAVRRGQDMNLVALPDQRFGKVTKKNRCHVMLMARIARCEKKNLERRARHHRRFNSDSRLLYVNEGVLIWLKAVLCTV